MQHVYSASDLVDGMMLQMPELHVTNPATTMPLMQPEHRRQLIENVQGAWELLRMHLDPVVLSQELVSAVGAVAVEAVSARRGSDDACPDTGASVDVARACRTRASLPSSTGSFWRTGSRSSFTQAEYAGRCKTTGYSKGVRERRRVFGMPEASDSQCCIAD